MRTDLENFIATTEHCQPGRILYHGSFVDDLRKRVIEHIGTEDIAGYYGFSKHVFVGPRRPDDLPPLDYSKYWEGEDLPEGTTINGQGVAMVPSGFYHFWGYVSPLRHARSLKEIEEYPLEDYSQWDFSHMKEEVKAAHAEGKFVVASVGHQYESAWQIRGLEEFLIDIVERPSWAECLLERLFQQNLIKAKAAAEAGVDMLHCGDDVANQKSLMFSKETWRKLNHSRWAKVWDAAKRIHPRIRIWYHSDGNITDIIPDLIDAGLDILNPLQPECLDLDEIHRQYGHLLTFDGTIGTQSTMPWGTPEDVRHRVKEVIDKYGRNGGLIISPTHVLEPEVPLANIDALFEACREFGTFDN
jgi:uroporphyrinogen decarboxylase